MCIRDRIERVPSEYNLADLPSRKEYGLVQTLGAQWMEPVIAKLYQNAQAVGVFDGVP